MYKGSQKPLTVLSVADDAFDADGLGGVAHEYSPCDKSSQDGHAADVLVDLVNKHPGIIII